MSSQHEQCDSEHDDMRLRMARSALEADIRATSACHGGMPVILDSNAGMA